MMLTHRHAYRDVEMLLMLKKHLHYLVNTSSNKCPFQHQNISEFLSLVQKTHNSLSQLSKLCIINSFSCITRGTIFFNYV